MDDYTGLIRSVCVTVGGYPINLARTLQQIGYEPQPPGPNGYLPNIFSYIRIIRERRGYLALYTGLRYHLPADILKQSLYEYSALAINHKRDSKDSDVSEIIAVCLRKSYLKIQAAVITYPLFTLSIGYISATFFGSDKPVDYTIETLYSGFIPKLIVEVTMVWVSVISRRIVASLIDDNVGQAIVSRVPPFIVQSFLYPLNVVATVMADNGRSGMGPKFDDWRQCYEHLKLNNQLKRGSSLFYRWNYQPLLFTLPVQRYY